MEPYRSVGAFCSSSHIGITCDSWGCVPNHPSVCGHCMLNFLSRWKHNKAGGRERQRARDRRSKREKACSPQGPRSCLSLCQNDSPCNWSVDTESTGQLWQPAWRVFVSYVGVGGCISASAFCLPRCQWLSVFISWCPTAELRAWAACMLSFATNEMRFR